MDKSRAVLYFLGIVAGMHLAWVMLSLMRRFEQSGIYMTIWGIFSWVFIAVSTFIAYKLIRKSKQ